MTRPPRPDRGAGLIEYSTVILLAAALFAAVATAGFGKEITTNVSAAVGCLVQSSGCEEKTDDSSGTQSGSGLSSESPPEKHPPLFSAEAEKSPRSYECGWWQTACDLAQGMGAEAKDAGVEIWEGFRGTGCLAHICNNEEFQATWSGIGQSWHQAFTDPSGAAEDSWNEFTDGPQRDYANGYEERSLGRSITLAGGTLLSLGGLGALKHLPKIPKKHKPAQHHRESAEDAARLGDASSTERHARAADESADESEQEVEENPGDYEAQEKAERDRRESDRAQRLVPTAEVVESLVATPSGRELNRVLNDHDVQIEFDDTMRDGLNGQYDPATNTITLNSRLRGSDQAVMTLAHEASHARRSKEGRDLPSLMDSKDDYVDGFLEDEAEARITEFKFAQELRHQGKDIPKSSMESRYEAYYENAMDSLESQGLSAEEMDMKASKKALAGFSDYFGDIKIKNSSTYREKFSNEWEEYN